MTDQNPINPPSPTLQASTTSERPARHVPQRAKRTPAGGGSRFLAAGGAVGLSLAAVGAMSAAAQTDEPTVEAPPVVQRVVLPQQSSTPQQIVIVLPSTTEVTPGTVTPQLVEPVVTELTAPAKPTPPPKPTPPRKKAPPNKAAAESSGS